MHRNFLQLLLISFGLQAILIVPPLVTACPTEMCVCKWKNGKQTAECSNRELSDLPAGLDVGTQVLNFTGNQLTYLKAEWFYQLNLINLQKIFMMRNQISKIHSRAFHGLSNLVELDLSDNQLTTVPTDSFADYGALMRLALSGNPIRALRSSAFKYLPHLTTLELTNCQIEIVESEAFIGMDNLEWLRLDGNRITTIRGTHLLPDSLHGISLQGNRWTCDCSMVDLHRWLSTSTVPQTEEPKCVQPTRLAGSTIRSVDRGQLACLPEITPSSLITEIAENRNLTLTCKVDAMPAATISWWFQGRALENYTVIGTNIHLLMTFTMEPNEAEKRIELFISNTTAETNGTFVCTAENAAGRVQANYTVRVIGKEEPIVEQVKFPFEYYLMFIAGAAGMSIIVLVILCIVIVKCCCSRRRQMNGRRGESGSNGEGSNGHWKKTHFANGDVQSMSNGTGGGMGGGCGLGGGMSGNVTLITDKVMGGQAAIIGPDHQLNGGLCYGNKQDVIMYVSSGLVGPDQRHDGDPTHPVGSRVATVSAASATNSPPHLVGNRNYSPDPINPDLINDTEKQRLTGLSNGGGGNTNNGGGSNNSSVSNHNNNNNNKSASQTNIPLYCNNSYSSQNGANLSGDSGKLREFVSQSYTRPSMQHPATHLGTLPRTRLLPADHHQQPGQQHHHHQADVHLNPGCFLTTQQGEHPVEYSLTNVMAVLPSGRQLVAGQQPQHQQQQHQQLGGQSMNFAYRTLPHRMKIRNGSTSPNGSNNTNSTGPTIRFSRDAEFLTSLPSQQHSFDMYTPANVRYTAEGYPYTAVGNFLGMPPLPALQTTIATTQQVVAFQDPALQFLPSPPEGYKMTAIEGGPEEGGVVMVDPINCSGGTVNQHWPACLPGYQHQAQTPNGSSVPTSQIVPIKTNFAQRFVSPLASPASSVTSSTSSSKLSTSTNTTTHSSLAGNNNNNISANGGPLNVISTGNQTTGKGEGGGGDGTASVLNQLPLHTPPPPVITKRCIAAQTMLMGPDDLPSSSACGGGCGGTQVVGRRIGLLATASTLNDVDETEEETEDVDEGESQKQQRGTCRHLNGPLADSPDEGYVGDSSHDGNGSSE